MPFYHKLGKIPHKRHTIFRKEDGSLHYEQLFGTEGFSGMSSLLYHLHRPTMVKEVKEPVSVAPKIAVEKNLKAYSLKGFNIAPEDDFLASRKPVLVNNDLYISLAAPGKSMTEYFYKNADADEMLFIIESTGRTQASRETFEAQLAQQRQQLLQRGVVLLHDDLELAAPGRLRLRGKQVQVQAEQGPVEVHATDDVVLRGEVIKLN